MSRGPNYGDGTAVPGPSTETHPPHNLDARKTLRDEFAMAVLPETINHARRELKGSGYSGEQFCRDVAAATYAMADAMMEARKQ